MASWDFPAQLCKAVGWGSPILPAETALQRWQGGGSDLLPDGELHPQQVQKQLKILGQREMVWGVTRSR